MDKPTQTDKQTQTDTQILNTKINFSSVRGRVFLGHITDYQSPEDGSTLWS
jgi:hypothetical protein